MGYIIYDFCIGRIDELYKNIGYKKRRVESDTAEDQSTAWAVGQVHIQRSGFTPWSQESPTGRKGSRVIQFMFNTWMDGLKIKLGFPGDSDGKESTFSAGDPGLILGRADSLEKGMQPNPVLLPRESKPHGQRSLVGYSPWAAKGWIWLSD